MQQRLQNLAALTGRPPVFPEPLHVGKPNIPDRNRFLRRVEAVLDRCVLTNNGPLVREFEDTLARLTGTRNCVAVCNGTQALELAARAVGLSGEVIVPSFTFAATVHALSRQGIRPVFCDIEPETYTIDPAQIEQLITPATTGILAVHLWGRPCKIETLEKIAAARSLRLVFDAAHALGCTYTGRPIGRFGDAEVFSFHATKFVNSIEGGAVVTNNDDFAQEIRLMRNFGFEGYDRVVSFGTNAKMHEISAAMGLTSLEAIKEIKTRNRINYLAYMARLERIPGISLVDYRVENSPNYQYVPVEVDRTIANVSRDALMQVLHAENVLARRYFHPGCHRMPPYAMHPHRRIPYLPVTERLSARVLLLPTGTTVTHADITSICAIIRLATGNGDEVMRWYTNKYAVPRSTHEGARRKDRAA